MKKKVICVLFVLILYSLVFVLPATAAANGDIAWSQYVGMVASDNFIDTRDLGLITSKFNPDVTFNNDQHPTWSPDGKKIAFSSTRHGSQEIYVIMLTADRPISRITNNAAADKEPAWSPDGTKLHLLRIVRAIAEICIMNTDGSSQNCITKSAASDSEPAWSPDGKKIAFTSNRDGNAEIYVMNTDGTSQTRITMNAASDSGPAWSPDGKKIAFTSNRDGNAEIYVMNTDGTAQTNLTNRGPVRTIW